MDQTLHALNRFGLGARPGERRSIRDPLGWVLAQLDLSASAPPGATSSADAADALRALRSAQQSSDRAATVRARRRVAAVAAADMNAVLAQRISTDAPVLERLVAFWSNHLCVSISGKAAVVPIAGAYECEVIRPHVLGPYEDMVLASARHPAMLLYLDNAQSIGPASRAGRGRARGLNENYARELLELHTLGVDGGYTQQDVQELARILTGWTVDGIRRGRRDRAPAGPLKFVFEPLMHDPGPKTVLGVSYGEAGAAEGVRAIRALCRHPSTARFIAAKLVRHFIDDEPPSAAVVAVADAFTKSAGDLRATTRALAGRPELWSAASRKFRTPHDWLIAVLRATDADDRVGALPPLLRRLRQPLWAPPAPNGFGDTMQEWADPDSLLNRAELARSIAGRIADGFDPRDLLDVVDTGESDPLRAMLNDGSVPVEERIAIAIASPAFQWR